MSTAYWADIWAGVCKKYIHSSTTTEEEFPFQALRSLLLIHFTQEFGMVVPAKAEIRN